MTGEAPPDRGAQDDEGVNALAERRAGLRDDRDLDDGGVREQGVLDLGSGLSGSVWPMTMMILQRGSVPPGMHHFRPVTT